MKNGHRPGDDWQLMTMDLVFKRFTFVETVFRVQVSNLWIREFQAGTKRKCRVHKATP